MIACKRHLGSPEKNPVNPVTIFCSAHDLVRVLIDSDSDDAFLTLKRARTHLVPSRQRFCRYIFVSVRAIVGVIPHRRPRAFLVLTLPALLQALSLHSRAQYDRERV